jgi:hypothetical protein
MKPVLALSALSLFGLALLTPTLAQDAMSEMKSMQHSDVQSSHNGSKEKKAKANQVTITPATLVAGKSQDLSVQVRSPEGKTIEKFDIQHEKFMHLIIVRNDLSYFTHLHSESVNKGKLQFTANLPTDGQYTAFADYVPKGSTQQVSTQTLSVGKDKAAASATPLTPDATLSKSVGDLKVSLLVDPKTIKPGQETAITLDIKDAAGKPVKDLQPYLGAMGHLIIIRQSPVLTAANYLHAHPKEHEGMDGMSNMSAMPGEKSSMAMEHSMDKERSKQSKKATATPGQVNFETAFPEAGVYKLWGQFQRNGKVITADFTIDI